jgi:glycosyltransferase involved in cell wall biosynthesis
MGWAVPGALAFVCPRYGTDVLGGAETVVRELAERLAARDFPVEVLSTCAQDHFTMANAYPAGETELNGVRVRRFPVEHGSGRERASIGARITAGLPVSYDEQERWINDWFRSARLYHFLMQEHSRYHTVVLSPYMFWTTYACAQIAPGKSVLRPCLHDEPEARLDIYRPIFRDARGITFNSPPEAELAERILELPRRSEVVGEGVAVPDAYSPERFRRAYGLDGDFILYAGRREGGKNTDMLLDLFAHFVAETGRDLRLVLLGKGEVRVPDAVKDRVVDLGFVSERDMHDGLAAATVVCQPSLYESFSRLIMEAWLAERPTLVYGASAVTSYHCTASRGGIVFGDVEEFIVGLELLLDRPSLRVDMGRNGRRYVLERFTWDHMVGRFVEAVGRWAAEDVGADAA